MESSGCFKYVGILQNKRHEGGASAHTHIVRIAAVMSRPALRRMKIQAGGFRLQSPLICEASRIMDTGRTPAKRTHIGVRVFIPIPDSDEPNDSDSISYRPDSDDCFQAAEQGYGRQTRSL
jgi:hypothetical protein